ncbi:MAG: hypothetical protein CMD14_04125 [Flavobacteriales bacterium]|nr:hypothetical protein [Flavobacteriales bacterium]
MPKRCPPGVICVENVTILFVLIIVGGVFLYLKMNTFKYNQNNKIIVKENGNTSGIYPRASYSFSNLENDVLMNPYNAPLKDDRVNPVNNLDPRGVPINIPTQSVNASYRQVGILTRLNGDGENILPLMGKPLFTNRDKWNYYTMTDKNNMIKLPITHKGRSCTNEYGCDSMYNGDTVYVEGYNDAFKVTMYENNTMQYIPHL